MHLTKIKKGVLTLSLAAGLAAGNFAAVSAIAAPEPSPIVTPGQTTETTRNVRQPSPIIVPGKGVITPATGSNATPSVATRSNSSSSSSSSSSSRRSSSSYSSSNPVSTSKPGSPVSNVGPAGTANNNAVAPASTAVKPSTKGKLNVPKTADASNMGLYVSLLGLSAIGGAAVLTKKKEN